MPFLSYTIFQVLLYIKAICLNEDVKPGLYTNRTRTPFVLLNHQDVRIIASDWSLKKGRGRWSRRYKPAECLHKKTWW